MTGDSFEMDGHAERPTEDGVRTAVIETTHDDPAVVAAALKPDNTADVETTVVDSTVVETPDRESSGAESIDGESNGAEAIDDTTGGVVRTRIQRETTGGLQSTVDDYVVNLTVAQRLSDNDNIS